MKPPYTLDGALKREVAIRLPVCRTFVKGPRRVRALVAAESAS